MNFIEIIWHDLGRHLNCYGWESVNSPNLDRLAEEGILFTQAFCTSPLCSPSRASIMTGRYPHNNGLIGLTHRGWRINEGEQLLPRLMKKAGYQTALFGFQHEVPHGEGETLGYEKAFEGVSDAVDVAGDSAYKPDVTTAFNQWLENDRDRLKPFFATIGLRLVHRPHNLGEYQPDELDTIRVPDYLPDTLEVRKDLAGYQGLIREADAIVGNILEIIERKGLTEDTVVLFTTDHGSDYPRAKSSLYDAGIGVALIMRVPGKPAGLKKADHLVSNVDFLPTLLEGAGIEIPDNVQGKSFWPLLSGKPWQPRTEIFAERTWQGTYDPIRCVRTDSYKLIRNFKPGRPHLVAPEFVRNIGTEVLEKHFNKTRQEYELYDLAADPGEFNNLAGRDEYKEIENDLRARLQKHLEATEDPIMAGDIPHPGRHDDVWDWLEVDGQWKLVDMKAKKAVEG